MANLNDLLRLNQQPVDINQGIQALAAQKLQDLAQRSLPQQPNLLQQLAFSQPQGLGSLLSPEQQTQLNQPLQNLLGAAPSAQIEEEIEEIEPELVTPKTKKARAARAKQDAALDRKIAAERRFQQQEQNKIDKETLPYYKDLTDAYEASERSNLRLDRMEELIKEGGLPISAFYNIFKTLEEVDPKYGAGIGGALGQWAAGPVGALAGAAIGGLINPVGQLLSFAQRKISPNTEEFEKLSSDFIRDAKNIFGSRVTDQDLRAFFKTIPTLANTDQGKTAIIRNMKLFNKGVETKYEVLKDILQEHKGKRPANLKILVEQRAKPELNKLAKQFTSGDTVGLLSKL